MKEEGNDSVGVECKSEVLLCYDEEEEIIGQNTPYLRSEKDEKDLREEEERNCNPFFPFAFDLCLFDNTLLWTAEISDLDFL